MKRINLALDDDLFVELKEVQKEQKYKLSMNFIIASLLDEAVKNRRIKTGLTVPSTKKTDEELGMETTTEPKVEPKVVEAPLEDPPPAVLKRRNTKREFFF
jgi:hypothetical protein